MGGKGSLCVGLTTLPSSRAGWLEILGASTSWSRTGQHNTRRIEKVKYNCPVQNVVRTYGGTEVELHIFVTSLRDTNKWVSFIPSPLFSPWNSLQYPLNRKLGGRRAGVDQVAGRKILCFSETPFRFPGHPVRILVTILKRYAGIWQKRFRGNRHNLRVQVLEQVLKDTVTYCGVN